LIKSPIATQSCSYFSEVLCLKKRSGLGSEVRGQDLEGPVSE